MNEPETLQQAIQYFSNPDICLNYVVARRWPDGIVTCPTCGRKDARFFSTRRLWECKAKHAKRQFSVKVGTVMEDSPIGLDKWLTAFWLLVNCKNGISSYEIARDLGISQKSAWHMMHRIRLAMQSGSFVKMGGNGSEVEVDETFIGGKARNMHQSKRAVRITGTGGNDKTAVVGLLERGGEFRATLIPNRKKNQLQEHVKTYVAVSSALYSDALKSYDGLDEIDAHMVIDHADVYVRDSVHTNGVENFWSLLKRGINGTYVSVEPFHLFRYLDEQTYRFNNRKMSDAERFSTAVCGIVGRRVTFKELTGESQTEWRLGQPQAST